MTAPKFTGLAGEKEKAYTLLDQTNQPVSEILAKTNEISWSLNSDWEKAAGFDATLFFNCQDGETKEITFIGGQRIDKGSCCMGSIIWKQFVGKTDSL